MVFRLWCSEKGGTHLGFLRRHGETEDLGVKDSGPVQIRNEEDSVIQR